MFKKIGIVVGTRPEAIKLIPVYFSLRKHFPAVELISTGQHASMLEQIFQFFEVKPDVSLDVMQPDQTLASLTARLSTSLQECYVSRQYDLIIVQGDTTTAFVAALIAFYNRIQIAHIEAGLRTYQKYSPFPEEVNRQLVGRIADYHFAPTNRALDVLVKEGNKNCFMVGNTVIDSLLLCLEKLSLRKDIYAAKYKIVDQYEKLVLITGHRRENFGKGFDEICHAVAHLAFKHPEVLFYYPVHLNPNVKNKVHAMLGNIANIILDEPMPYDELVYLMSRSFLILTDSGGIQEEGPSLNVPILVMRDTTERPEGVEQGCAVLVGTAAQHIIAVFEDLFSNRERYSRMAGAQNPYGDGLSAERIASCLMNQTAAVS